MHVVDVLPVLTCELYSLVTGGLKKVYELQVEKLDLFVNSNGGNVNTESWQCSFSSDDRVFAWSRGRRQVSLIPLSQLTQ